MSVDMTYKSFLSKKLPYPPSVVSLMFSLSVVKSLLEVVSRRTEYPYLYTNPTTSLPVVLWS